MRINDEFGKIYGKKFKTITNNLWNGYTIKVEPIQERYKIEIQLY